LAGRDFFLIPGFLSFVRRCFLLGIHIEDINSEQFIEHVL
jgi:hypothetical protein